MKFGTGWRENNSAERPSARSTPPAAPSPTTVDSTLNFVQRTMTLRSSIMRSAPQISCRMPSASVLLRVDRTVQPLVRNCGPPVSSNATLRIFTSLGAHGGKNVLGASDRRELTMKTRQRDAVHEIRAVVGSIWAPALKGRGCILDHGDGETKVSRRPGRSRHAVVGGDPDHDECLDSIGAQIRLKVGSDEGTVDMLAEDRFVGHRQRLDLEGVARRVFAKWGVGFKRQMLDVNDRPASGAPSRKQIGNPLFRIGIIPCSPARIVKALLHVDEE